MGDTADWVSAVCSIVAACVGLITLATIVLAADELIVRRRRFRECLSRESLTAWKGVVEVKSPMSYFSPGVRTLEIFILRLGEKNWDPEVKLPLGFQRPSIRSTIGRSRFSQKQLWWLPELLFHRDISRDRGTATANVDIERQKSIRTDFDGNTKLEQAHTSWVNFLQAIDVTPSANKRKFYEFRSELMALLRSTNGRVPMRWRREDLMVLCSILGFQSCGRKESGDSPKSFPIYWAGSLGSLNFSKPGNEDLGCKVEFGRTLPQINYLPIEFSKFYESYRRKPFASKSRLWYSVDALSINDDRGLFFFKQEIPRRKDEKKKARVESALLQIMDASGPGVDVQCPPPGRGKPAKLAKLKSVRRKTKKSISDGK